MAVFIVMALFGACRTRPGGAQEPHGGTVEALEPPEGRAVATFAGGCFWCMEGPFEALDGVDEVLSGYTGGTELHPTYEQVGHGQTTHTESIRIVYDPARVTYEQLLDVFWRQVDPTDANGQFVDRGQQYRPAIFVHDAAQRAAAEASRDALAAEGRFPAPIVLEIVDAGAFWVAEDYHQDYYETNPGHYRMYRAGSGRDGFINRIWGEGSGH
jgi:methionine-S-sulfoxide reductase